MHAVYEPAVCIVAQGRKQSIAGEDIYVYDPEKYLVVSVGVPAVGRILEASPDRPFLCLALSLDPAAIGDRSNRERHPADRGPTSCAGRELLRLVMEVDEALDPITTASLTGGNDSALAVPRIRFFRSEVIPRDRLGHDRALDPALIGERLERGDRHVMAVDLEEAA